MWTYDAWRRGGRLPPAVEGEGRKVGRWGRGGRSARARAPPPPAYRRLLEERYPRARQESSWRAPYNQLLRHGRPRLEVCVPAAVGLAGRGTARSRGCPARAAVASDGRRRAGRAPRGDAASHHSRTASREATHLMDAIYNECLAQNSVPASKYKLFSLRDRCSAQRTLFSLTEGVTVVKTPGAADAKVGGAPRGLGDDDSVEGALASRLEQFLETHTLKIDLSGKDVLNSVTSVGRALGDVADGLGLTEEEDDAAGAVGEEGRGKKKKAAKILMPLLLALKLKAAALIPLALGAIALIAGKALLIGKIALLLAAIIGLKKLLSQQKTVTYEIVAHPHHTSSHGGGHDAYSAIGGGLRRLRSGRPRRLGRALDAQQLAYRGYPQAQPQQ
ncbi:Uncharacterized protein GBIM_16964 [Gryllus bimaculatus]|nr:Uncharacterized protein GBIM_16964 [Gryllus bimaculatus]